MKKMKKKKILKMRLPMDAVLALRKKGGVQTSPKGKKGYNRKNFKKDWKEE